jgi:hypothetical protein
MQTFFDLAWNVEQFDYVSINEHQSRYLAGYIGDEYQEELQDILDTYYRLAWSRKPEFMGWEREWDHDKTLEKLADTEYSFKHYNDARQRLADYKRISDLAQGIEFELPEKYRPAFFEVVAYPVMGAYQMNRKFLLAQLSNEMKTANNHKAANWAAREAEIAFDSINSLSAKYNALLDGKWNGMMMLAPGWVAKYQNMPDVEFTEELGAESVDVGPQKDQEQLEGCTVIDLKKYSKKEAAEDHTLRQIRGIGYDWLSIQLGEATEREADPKDLNGSRFEYEFSAGDADSVTVYVYSVPFFPLYKGKSTRYGISVDGHPAIEAKNEPKEFSREWKDQVLQNGVVAEAKFPLRNDLDTHTLSLICGDPGVIIQRVVIDWGGLQESYVGPSVDLFQAGNE